MGRILAIKGRVIYQEGELVPLTFKPTAQPWALRVEEINRYENTAGQTRKTKGLTGEEGCRLKLTIEPPAYLGRNSPLLARCAAVISATVISPARAAGGAAAITASAAEAIPHLLHLRLKLLLLVIGEDAVELFGGFVEQIADLLFLVVGHPVESAEPSAHALKHHRNRIPCRARRRLSRGRILRGGP
jgi:hypothetical protein